MAGFRASCVLVALVFCTRADAHKPSDSYLTISRGEGRLEPRTITTGAASEDQIEVLSGLEPGERVVASGNFLIAAESRIQSALEQW